MRRNPQRALHRSAVGKPRTPSPSPSPSLKRRMKMKMKMEKETTTTTSPRRLASLSLNSCLRTSGTSTLVWIPLAGGCPRSWMVFGTVLDSPIPFGVLKYYRTARSMTVNSSSAVSEIRSRLLNGSWTVRRIYQPHTKINNTNISFVLELPKDVTLDGELYAGRGEFQSTVSIVKTINSIHWKNITFQVRLHLFHKKKTTSS